MAEGAPSAPLSVMIMDETPDQRDDRQPAGSGVAAAMNRVLKAERMALAEVEACRLQAEKTLESARHEARSVLERAERIARDIHARTGRLAEARARQLRERWARDRDAEADGEALAAAVRRLAAKMTGGDDA